MAIHSTSDQWREISPHEIGHIVTNKVYVAYDVINDVFTFTFTPGTPAFVETSPGVYEPQASPAGGAIKARLAYLPTLDVVKGY
jgi:hypothetical protein